MAGRKRQAMADAKTRGDRGAQARIMKWNPGGRLPHHKHLQRARSEARKHGHLLGRFGRGKDAEGNPDPWTYGAECRFCGQCVLVFHDDDGEWKIAGSPLKCQCKGK